MAGYTEHSSVAARRESRLLTVLLFGLHQVIATVGVMVATPVLLALLATALRPLGLTLRMREFHELLTGTSYFPLQVAVAVSVGWLLGRHAWHRSMLWVWGLPLVVLFLVFVTNHHVVDLEPTSSALAQTRLSHFFGTGCRPQNHCFDQIVTTLPFYSAAAYSLGAALARRPGRAQRGSAES